MAFMLVFLLTFCCLILQLGSLSAFSQFRVLTQLCSFCYLLFKAYSCCSDNHEVCTLCSRCLLSDSRKLAQPARASKFCVCKVYRKGEKSLASETTLTYISVACKVKVMCMRITIYACY